MGHQIVLLITLQVMLQSDGKKKMTRGKKKKDNKRETKRVEKTNLPLPGRFHLHFPQQAHTSQQH